MNMADVTFLLANAIALPHLLFCGIMSATTVATSDMSTFLFERIANKRFTNVTATFTKVSLLQCGRLCTNSEWCNIFNFHSADNICQICPFHPGNSDLMAEENGWKMFYAVHSCLPGWTNFQRSCYLFDETQQSADQARTSCSVRIPMTHLVYIKSQDEQDFIEAMVQNANTGNGIWLGAHADGVKFTWDDGAEFSYLYWGPGEPHDFGIEPYIAAARLYNWAWVDVPQMILSSVCEYELA